MALDWFTKSAERGFAQAQLIVGKIHEIGEIVPQDMAEALEWYTKSAEQGSAQAQAQLDCLAAHT